MVITLKDLFLDFIFPPRCVICGQLGCFICPACEAKIVVKKSQNCPICRSDNGTGQLCKRCRPHYHLTGVICYGYFRDAVLKEAIHHFKYEGIRALDAKLSEYLIQTISTGGIKFDVVAYAPVSRKRFNERGYNQAEVLARAVARHFDRPLYRGLVKENRAKPQVGLKRRERLGNIQGSIRLNHADRVRGKKVLLIDDVLTTGATLDECARVLRLVGAHRVWGAVLAHD